MVSSVRKAGILWRQLASVLLCCCLVNTAGAAKEPAKEWGEVRDPYYGEVLFQFYQQSYFSALTSLKVSQHFERMPNHKLDADVLHGGLLLSYGMYLPAEQIFRDLVESGAVTQRIQDRAWFYLAKIFYTRGYLDEAHAALGRVAGTLPEGLHEESLLLGANLYMSRGEYGPAVDLLRQVSPKTEWGLYGRYNLGVALIKMNRPDQGVPLLEEVGKNKVRTEEFRSLRDKANVALGYSFLANDTPITAKNYLERVRLKGLQSASALLAMGWAQAAQEQYDRALVPWLELQGRNEFDAAVQESWLAVPYAYGKLGAELQSLTEYKRAIARYSHELGRLDQAIQEVRAGKLANALIELGGDEQQEMGWFWSPQALPALPAGRYLLTLLASHDFQEAMKNYRDVQFLRRDLVAWQDKVSIYRDMLDNRRRAYSERLPRVLGAQRQLDTDRLKTAYSQAAAELKRIEANDDVLALADEKQLAQRARLDRLSTAIKRTGDPALTEKFWRLRGLLLWDVSEEYMPRLAEAKRSLADVEQRIGESDDRRARLQQAQRDMPIVLDGFAARIEGLNRRIARLQVDLARAGEEQGAHVARLAVAELERQRERTTVYLTQARFAVAQMYDQASSNAPAEAPP